MNQLNPDHISLREELIRQVRLELLGPSAPDERINQRPQDKYLLGGLFPSGTAMDEESTEEDATANAGDEDTEASTTSYGGMKQAAIGLTVVFPASANDSIVITATYGTYERIASPHAPVSWQRTQHEVSHLWRPKSSDAGSKGLPEGASLEWKARVRNDNLFLTVSLVNRGTNSLGTKRSIHQPEIRVRSVDPIRTPFIDGTRHALDDDDPDRESDRLLYRDVKEYAAGHGCATRWSTDGTGRTIEVHTELLPQYEVPAIVPRESTSAELGMESLAFLHDDSELATRLRPLAIEYQRWISEQRIRATTLPATLQVTATRHLDECQSVADRIEDGIRLLESDPIAAESFRLANAAMALQRRQSYIASQFQATGRRSELREPPRWRPFQLAFFLINLRPLSIPGSSDSGYVDLLWFPTGGGKTEAYLGLTAFALFQRRQGVVPPGTVGELGTCVLMRYTLRLLTAQQFERAAALICACEVLRREDPNRLGTTPFSIGLWVGQASTPNHFDQVVTALAELDGTKPIEEHPFVLRTCPWCGERLGRVSFHADYTNNRLCISCTRPGCDFTLVQGSLPVQVVDDDIYRRPPSMLVGTVDKFARLPWVPDAASLFGHAGYECTEHGFTSSLKCGCSSKACRVSPATSNVAPPSLIIQDELHLISGPLGSLVGLYEAAVEYLCQRYDGTTIYRPKVVASTATIRRAEEQVRALFARDVRLFPPPAIDPFESYFAQRAPSDERPGRMFLGLCAYGRSSKTMQVRLYSTLLRAIYPYKHLPEADAYWTLVGYYNSLSQLGGAVSLVQDDIQTRLKALRDETSGEGRLIERDAELTSRVGSTQIPHMLTRLQETLQSGMALDILLASNMISVGLDVGRLGLMVINNQPKTTSEYIQAASRVGRESPGLVIIAYNWAAPRDLSHYEHFLTYHESLYRHVEATSVTPFSPRARDRALHAVLITALRLTHAALAPDEAADTFSKKTFPVDGFVRFLVNRAQFADPTSVSSPEDSNEIEAELEYIAATWEAASANPSIRLKYHQYLPDPPHRKSTRIPLMVPAGSDFQFVDTVTFPTLNSLRDVEEESQWRRLD